MVSLVHEQAAYTFENHSAIHERPFLLPHLDYVITFCLSVLCHLGTLLKKKSSNKAVESQICH